MRGRGRDQDSPPFSENACGHLLPFFALLRSMCSVLQLQVISHSQDKTHLWSELQGEGTLWIVSTAEAKRRLQVRELESVDIINTQNILRATEYWSTLFVTNCPEKQHISDSLIYILIENWYKTAQVAVEHQDIQRFKTFCDQIFPVLSSPEKKLFYDWIAEDPFRSQRLMGWTKAADQFLKELNRQNVVGSSWLISTLLSEHALKGGELYFGPYKKFVFDLGNEIQPEEVQLIQHLSEVYDVTVIAPGADYLMSYRSGRCYQKLDVEYVNRATASVAEKKYYLRTGSVLSEVKAITAYVRERLEAGVSPRKIAITCADPESYWDLLKTHFDKEGVPVDKSVVAKVTALPYFQEWLSRIKVLTKMYSSGDLESFLNAQNYFSKDKDAYLEFKKNFSRLYDIEAATVLLRETKVYHAEKILSFDDFISFLYVTWTNPEYHLYNKMVDALIRDFRGTLKFTLTEWTSYLSLVLSRLEAPIEPPDREGVVFSGPHQLDHLLYTHIFVLGCHRGAMQVTNNTPFVPEDVSRLENDLGYYLPPCEDKKVEYDILWALSAPDVEAVLSYAETDFNGDPSVVAQVWLEWSSGAEEYVPQRLSRWDSIIRQNSLAVVSSPKMLRENDIAHWAPLGTPFQGRLSVSAFQTYKYCPFTFYATRLLQQEELRELDLEIDPLFQGSFLHKILEVLLLKFPDLQITEDQLSRMYQEVLESKEVSEDIRPDVLAYWKREKHRHLLMIRRFLEEEREWRMRLPQTRVDTVETSMKGFIGVSCDELQLSPESKPGFYPFAAKIDRIDKDAQDHLAVYDYKTSKPGDFKAFKSWPESFQIQMPLYAMGLESGLSPEHPHASVMMASYIFLRDGSRGSGYVLQGIEHGFQNAVTSSRSGQVAPISDKEAVFNQIKLQLKDMIQNIEKGQFLPVPSDREDCVSCHWRKTCRAPHLK